MKHSFQARFRAFRIWQRLGCLPWRKAKKVSRKGDFYKGAFDSIPFLNEDAKRTFSHLLLRPGYMMRDYIKGQHERYLAPLTALIIFYAFFALMSSIVNPEFSTKEKERDTRTIPDEIVVHRDTTEAEVVDIDLLRTVMKNRHLFSLDKHPEDVDSPLKASIAAFEGALRSQGVYLFLGNFLLLWAAMILTLRKRKMNASASAAIAAYVLCQFCFFMLFSLFFPFGTRGEIGLWLMVILLVIDYCQLFEIKKKEGLRLTIKTGVMYGLVYIAFFALAVLVLVLANFVALNLKK